MKHLITAAFIFATSQALAGGQVGGGSGGNPQTIAVQSSGGSIGGGSGYEGGTVGGTGPAIESLGGFLDFCVDGGGIGGGGLGFADLIQLLIGGSGGGGTPPCDAN